MEKQTLRTRITYLEVEYAKPALLTVGLLAIMASETVMGGLGLGEIIGDWAFSVSFALAVLQVLASHSWGSRTAHNATRAIRVSKKGRETAASEPAQDPRLPQTMSLITGAVSIAFGALKLVPGMATFTGNPLAGWALGVVFSTASPAAAIGLALLMGNEAQTWRAHAAWARKQADAQARSAASRAATAQRKAATAQKEARAVQHEADRAQAKADAVQEKAARAQFTRDERRDALLEALRRDPDAGTRKLAAHFGVDESTIRRDVQALQEAGKAWQEANGSTGVIK